MNNTTTCLLIAREVTDLKLLTPTKEKALHECLYKLTENEQFVNQLFMAIANSGCYNRVFHPQNNSVGTNFMVRAKYESVEKEKISAIFITYFFRESRDTNNLATITINLNKDKYQMLWNSKEISSSTYEINSLEDEIKKYSDEIKKYSYEFLGNDF